MRKSASVNTRDKRLYWQSSLNEANFIFVRYYVETPFDLESAAAFMAEEQSLPVDIADKIPVKFHVEERIARIVEVKQANTSNNKLLPTYWLGELDVNAKACLYETKINAGEITLAFPVAGFGDNLTHLWSIVFGELPRHGTLSAFKILDIVFPDEVLDTFHGPQFGIAGIRQLCEIKDRPIFARSTQPPVGLSTQSIIKISTEVLTGGFDVIKDDELTLNDPLSPFNERIKAMASLVKNLSQTCNEKKLYFANIIDSPLKSATLLDFAQQAGVDGAVVSSALQGIEFIREIRNRSQLPILAHNAGIDMLTRHPRLGVDYALSIKLDRLCGADLAMLPGSALTLGSDDDELQRCLDACFSPLGPHKPIMPILAGGKKSSDLELYCDRLDTTDFMLIVATDVDDDPQGQRQGAEKFRKQWQKIQRRERNH